MATNRRRAPGSARRRLVAIVVVAGAVVLGAIGAPWYVNRVEDDLTSRVLARAGDVSEAINGVSVSGQNVTLFCTEPVTRPSELSDGIADVRGVRSVDVDRSCRITRAPTVGTTTESPDGTTPTTVPPDVTLPVTDIVDEVTVTVDEVVAADPQLSYMAGLLNDSGLLTAVDAPDGITVLVPIDAAFDELGADQLSNLTTDADTTATLLRHHVLTARHPITSVTTDATASDGGIELSTAAADTVLVTSDADGLLLDGLARVLDTVEVARGHVWLIDAVLVPTVEVRSPTLVVSITADQIAVSGTLPDATTVADITNALSGDGDREPVIELGVDPSVSYDAEVTSALTRLLVAVVNTVQSASITLDADGLVVAGTYTDAVDDADVDALGALAAAANATLDLVEVPAPVDSTAARAAEEIAVLVAEGNIDFAPNGTYLVSGLSTLVEVAAVIESYPELDVIVRGHTDSDGIAESNLDLSRQRASEIVAALVNLGVDADRLSAVGVGSAEPILVDGVEDKDASRRVEFAVVMR